MKKILILNNNYFGDRLGGISIRSFEIAKALSRHHKVTLALSNIDRSLQKNEQGLDIVPFSSETDILSLLKKHDAVLSRGLNIIGSKKLRNYDIPMIFDLLCPFFLEDMEADKTSPVQFNSSVSSNIGIIKQLAERGDFFICANSNQRELWLGLLYNHKRITLDLYKEDPSLKNLMGIVPFGLPSLRPEHDKRSIKGVIKGINETDKVIIWFGGLWDWLDPLSLIEAVKNICRQRSDIKLVFVGIKHPDPKSKPHEIYKNVMEETVSSGLLDKNIFFIDWVPYEERHNYLLESDIGIVTHKETLETEFSWRTRVLDYIWAELPIILTKGDPMSGVIEKNKLGMSVEYGDPRSIEGAITGLIDNDKLIKEIRGNIRAYSKELTWDNVILPIAEFCKDPKRTSRKTWSLW